MELGAAVRKLPPLRYVQIQTVSQCNADCVFCPWVESWHAANPGRMSWSLWEKILSDLGPFEKTLSKGMIAPYLMNEPLLDPELPKRIASIYDAFPGTMVTVATNGAALTPRNVDRLLQVLEGRKHQIWVSHHGVDESSMREIMRLDLARAEANLVHLLKRSGGRHRILIRGAGEQRDGGRRWFSASEYRDYWEVLFDRHDIVRKRVHVDAFTFHDRAGTLRREDRGSAGLTVGRVRTIGPENPFGCTRVDEWLHVLYDGTIRICCMDYHGEVSLPSLVDMSVQEYFSSEAYATLAATVSGRAPGSNDGICTRCVSPGG